MSNSINTEVRKGYTVQPTDNGGVIVYALGGEPGYSRNVLASFSTVEDYILWLSRSHLAKLLVLDPEKVDIRTEAPTFMKGPTLQ